MFRQVVILLLVSNHIVALTSSICAEVPNGNYVRSSQSCNSYNHCINGQITTGVCPKGFSFSPLSQMCDYNINVDCRLCSPFGIQNIPVPDSCYMYYRCVNGVRTTMVCLNGLLFDRSFGDCNFADRVICETRNTICEPFASLGTVLIGNPLDCSSYYYCINGNAIESVCHNGLLYNPHTATCEIRGTTNFCQSSGPIITTPRPVLTTREAITLQPTTTTTVKIIYVTPTTTTTTTTATTTTATSTTTPVTTTTSTASTTTTTTTTTATTTTAITTTTEETTTEEVTTPPTPPTPPAPTSAPVLTCETARGYFPFPPPDNCVRYYYCSTGIVRYQYECRPPEFFTPGGDRCTTNVPPGCEHLVP